MGILGRAGLVTRDTLSVFQEERARRAPETYRVFVPIPESEFTGLPSEGRPAWMKDELEQALRKAISTRRPARELQQRVARLRQTGDNTVATEGQMVVVQAALVKQASQFARSGLISLEDFLLGALLLHLDETRPGSENECGASI